MKKKFFAIVAVCAVLAITLVSGSIAFAKDGEAIKSVAIISLSVSDVGGSVTTLSVGSTPVADLITSAVDGMLADAETKLATKWKVQKAAGFIDNAAYQKASVEKKLTVYQPKVSGKDMPVFTQVSKEIKGGVIDAEKAKELCKALNVDGVVLIFSEWSSKTGSMIPTTKALTKNILSVYDVNGKQVIKQRVDMVGNKSLGMSGFKAVNQETIGEWRDSYNRALDKILTSL